MLIELNEEKAFEFYKDCTEGNKDAVFSFCESFLKDHVFISGKINFADFFSMGCYQAAFNNKTEIVDKIIKTVYTGSYWFKQNVFFILGHAIPGYANGGQLETAKSLFSKFFNNKYISCTSLILYKLITKDSKESKEMIEFIFEKMQDNSSVYIDNIDDLLNASISMNNEVALKNLLRYIRNKKHNSFCPIDPTTIKANIIVSEFLGHMNLVRILEENLKIMEEMEKHDD
jgi:hypothetical protein